MPQLGLVPATRVRSSAAAGAVLADYLERLPGRLTLTVDFAGDMMLVVQALLDSGRMPILVGRIDFDVADWVAAPGTEAVWDGAFERGEEDTGLLRHHALLDSRVLREVFQALASKTQG